MSDINDLTTLPLPTVVNMNSTFFQQTITFQNGDTLGAGIDREGPQGVFSAVPEPATLVFLSLSLVGLCFARRHRRG